MSMQKNAVHLLSAFPSAKLFFPSYKHHLILPADAILGFEVRIVCETLKSNPKQIRAVGRML